VSQRGRLKLLQTPAQASRKYRSISGDLQPDLGLHIPRKPSLIGLIPRLLVEAQCGCVRSVYAAGSPW
jgi:hypothetical protein